MADNVYGAKLTADASGYVAGITPATQAQADLNKTIGDTAKQSRDFVDALKSATDSTSQTGKAAGDTAKQSRDFVDVLKQQTGAANDAGGALNSLVDGMARGHPVMRALISAGGLWGIAIGAIAVASYNAYQAHEQLERQLNRTEVAFAAQGRAGELSRTQLADLRHEVMMTGGASGEMANQVVAAYVRSRAIGGAVLGELARLTADYATATGRDLPQAAQRLADAFNDPVKGARELDRELGLLSASQALAVQRFNEMGQSGEAQQIMLTALRDRVQGLHEQALTPLEESLGRLTGAWPKLMDRMGANDGLASSSGFMASIVASAAWLVEHADVVARAVPGVAWVLAHQEQQRSRDDMAATYDRRGFQGDVRDLQAAQFNAERQAAGERTKDLFGRYDRQGTRRRQLEGDIGFMEAELGRTDVAGNVRSQLAAELASAREQLDKLNDSAGSGVILALQERLSQASGDASEFDKAMRLLTEGTKQYTQAEQATILALAGEIDMRRQASKEQEAAQKLLARDAQNWVRHAEQLNREWEGLVDTVNEHGEAVTMTAAAYERMVSDHNKRQLEGHVRAAQSLVETWEGVVHTVDQYGNAITMSRADWDAQQQKEAQARAKLEGDFKRTSDQIQNTLSQALVQGFMNGGRDGGQILVNAIKASLTTAVISPIVGPLTAPIAQAITGALWGGVAGGAAGGAGASMAPFIAPVAAGAGLLYAQQSGLWDRMQGSSLAKMTGLSTMMDLADPFGFMGGGGGPKPARFWLQKNAPGASSTAYSIGQSDAFGDDFVSNVLVALNEKLSDRNQYDPAILDTLLGEVSGGDAGAVFQQLMARLSAAQLVPAEQLMAQRTALMGQAVQLRGQLPQQLGVSGLTSYLQGLSTSTYDGSPLDRVAAARSLFESTAERARGNDLDALADLPRLHGELTRLASEVYASGPEFQSIYSSSKAVLEELRDAQQALVDDILKDLPAITKEAGQLTVEAIGEQTKQLVAKLNELTEAMQKRGMDT